MATLFYGIIMAYAVMNVRKPKDRAYDICSWPLACDPMILIQNWEPPVSAF